MRSLVGLLRHAFGALEGADAAVLKEGGARQGMTKGAETSAATFTKHNRSNGGRPPRLGDGCRGSDATAPRRRRHHATSSPAPRGPNMRHDMRVPSRAANQRPTLRPVAENALTICSRASTYSRAPSRSPNAHDDYTGCWLPARRVTRRSHRQRGNLPTVSELSQQAILCRSAAAFACSKNTNNNSCAAFSAIRRRSRARLLCTGRQLAASWPPGTRDAGPGEKVNRGTCTLTHACVGPTGERSRALPRL